MSNFDPYASWQPLEDAANNETNPRRKTLIKAVRDHMEYEIKGQLDDLMSTLTAEPIYHFWGNGEPMVIQGRQAVTDFYAGMIAGGGQQFHVVLEKVIANDDHVITEGQVRQAYKAKALEAMGVTEGTTGPISSSDYWLSDAQLVTIWPADADGKLIGEDIYFGQAPMSTLRPISAADIPDYYKFMG